MAHAAATTTTEPIHTTRKYRLRNSPPSRARRALRKASSISSPISLRGVLLPLHPNLRRLPSRLALLESATMPAIDTLQVGSKRKRVVSTNENAHAHGRSLRKLKRRKGYKEESEDSEMDVDDDRDSAWFMTEEDDQQDLGTGTCFLIDATLFSKSPPPSYTFFNCPYHVHRRPLLPRRSARDPVEPPPERRTHPSIPCCPPSGH